MNLNWINYFFIKVHSTPFIILLYFSILISKFYLKNEIKKAAHYLDSNPKKTLEICEKMKGKYKGNERLLEEIKHLEEWISKKGDN